MFLIMAFLAGIYAILSLNPKYLNPTSKENMESGSDADKKPEEPSCPDMLVQRGNTLLLYNSNQPMVDGVNPLPFYNLDEYINYLEIQRKSGINCPVLYLKMEYNTQGDEVYRMRPSPFDLQGGQPTMSDPTSPPPTPSQILDASRDNPPYNANNYAGFDPAGLYVGSYTEIDKIHDSTRVDKLSDNPMDPNWGGVQYTNQVVDSGKYAENAVSRPALFTPKTVFYPQLQNGGPQPIDII